MEFQEPKENTSSTVVLDEQPVKKKDSKIIKDNIFDESLWAQQDDDLPLWRMWR